MPILLGTRQFSSESPPLAGPASVLPLSPFDHDGWKKAKGDLRKKMRIAVVSWAENGVGGPPLVYAFYLIKHAAWAWGWSYFASFGHPNGSGRADSSKLMWWDLVQSEDAFQRLILWNLLFESCGFGCASGPLTGRFTLPSPAIIQWLWPGTIKLPFRLDYTRGRRGLIPGVGTSRTILDAGLFVAFVAATLRGLMSPSIGFGECAPIVVLLTVLGLSDFTIWLAARSEVYIYMTVCLLSAFGDNTADEDKGNATWITGVKLCQLAIWAWASISKWGPWFPHTVQAMMCNCMVWPFSTLAFHKLMFVDQSGGDFRPSVFCKVLAHMGTVTEFLFMVLLACGGKEGYLSPEGSPLGKLGLFVAVCFHVFILIQVAAGVPQEWNLFTITAALHLFDLKGGVSFADVSALPITLKSFLAIVLIAVPLFGNFFPRYVSFLPSMRYYAGNWPISVWLFRRDALPKLDRLKSVAGNLHDQTWMLYGEKGPRQYAEAKSLAFLSLHCHGRLLPGLLSRALQSVGGEVGEGRKGYQIHLGETVAGGALGYNFGDGGLHGPFLMEAMQERCQFEQGECVQVFIDSCSLFGNKFPWVIKDAANIESSIAVGNGDLWAACESQPY